MTFKKLVLTMLLFNIKLTYANLIKEITPHKYNNENMNESLYKFDAEITLIEKSVKEYNKNKETEFTPIVVYDDESNRYIVDLIKEKMESEKVSKTELAEFAGCTLASMSRYLNYERTMPYNTIVKCLNKFNLAFVIKNN